MTHTRLARMRPEAPSASAAMVRVEAELAAAGGFGLISIVQPLCPTSASVSEEETALKVTEEPAAPLEAIVETHVIVSVCAALVATAPFVIVRTVPVPVMADDVKAWVLTSVHSASAWSAVQICDDAVSVITPVVAGSIVVVLSAKTTLVGGSAEKSVLGVAAIHESDVACADTGACVGTVDGACVGAAVGAAVGMYVSPMFVGAFVTGAFVGAFVTGAFVVGAFVGAFDGVYV